MPAPRGRGRPDRIELLDADADPVHWIAEPAPTTPVRRPAGRRRAWIGLAAAGGLAAVIIAANVIGGPDEHRRAAPEPTTTGTATTSSSPAPTTAAVPPRTVTDATFVDDSPRLVADAPPGLVIVSAARFDAGSGDQRERMLFAAEPAVPASSPWVLATVEPSPTIETDPVSTAGDERVPVAAGVAIVDRDPSGIVTMTAPVPGGELALQSSGVDDATLAAIAGESAITGDRLDTQLPFTDRGFALVVSSGAGGVDPATIGTVISLQSLDDPAVWISVTVGATLAPFDRAARAFMLRDAHVVVLDGVRLAIVGTDARIPELRTAIVDVDGIEVTIGGQADEPAILAVAGALRIATEAEWQALQTAADDAARASAATAPPWSSTFLRSATMTGALPWRLELQSGGGPDAMPYLTVETSGATTGSVTATFSAGVMLDEQLAGGGPGIQSIATSVGVVLVAVAGREQAGARLVVTADAATLTDDVTDPGDTAPGLFAAAGYSELVAYHAELVAADGTVLATLDGM